MTVEQIAQVCHEANAAYCRAIGDNSQTPWDLAPDWQKDASRQGVQAALDGATPEALHIKWVAEKKAAGWRYGPEKKPDELRHPCMVPYYQLPEEQRRKDMLFAAIVKALA